MVSPAENLELVAPFLKPGPDELSFLFNQMFWDAIKGDLINLVQAFQKRSWISLGSTLPPLP
jgi:hypothetical protein